MSLFKYDQLVYEADLCGLKEERGKIELYIKNKRCIRIYGRRNFGKTSLVKNVIAKHWQDANPDKRLVIYVDFFPIKDEESLNILLTKSLNDALSRRKKIMEKFTSIVKNVTKLRPVFRPSSDGSSMELSLALDHGKPLGLADYFKLIKNLALDHEILLIFDEFQEIIRCPGVDARFRGELQELGEIPVITLGSKYHVLNEIFSKPRNPFHNWGLPVEFKPIPYEEYHRFIVVRWQTRHLSANADTTRHLQDLMHRIPEDINRLGDYIADHFTSMEITQAVIDQSLLNYLSDFKGIYESMAHRMAATEIKLLAGFIHMGGEVLHPTGKEFLKKVDLSKQGVAMMLIRLEDEGIIYRDGESYQIAEPLFYYFLKNRYFMDPV